MPTIQIAVIGLGNCASSLIQSINYYRKHNPHPAQDGLMHTQIGPYHASDIDVVCAFDIDARKVGKTIAEAIFSEPNCSHIFQKDIHRCRNKVLMGPVLDGLSSHMRQYGPEHSFIQADMAQPTKKEVVHALKQSGAKIMINYLPAGSQQATEFYAECALEAEMAFINHTSAFIACNPNWARRFKQSNLPIIGDDAKDQMDATITHKNLIDFMAKRGVKVNRTYQLNTSGNTDCLNMSNPQRRSPQSSAKNEAVTSPLPYSVPQHDVHVGACDYVPWQKDNKASFIRIEGELCAGVPMHLECRLSVEDSPNSAGIAIDTVRCAQLALDHKLGGVLTAPSAYFCKHTIQQFSDDQAHQMTETFIQQYSQQQIAVTSE